MLSSIFIWREIVFAFSPKELGKGVFK